MEESLKTIRFVHWLVVSVSAALVLFAISAQPPSNSYKDALAEFKMIAPAYSKLAESQAASLKTAYSQSGLLELLSKYGMQVERVEPTWRLSKDTPLAEVFSFINDPDLGHVYALETGPLEKELAEHLNEHGPSRLCTLSVEWSAPPPLLFPDDGRKIPVGTLTVTVRSASGEIFTDLSHYFSRPSRLDRAKATSLLEQFKLSIQSSAGRDVLPAIRTVWDTVGHVDYGMVESTLTRRSKEEDSIAANDISLMGLTFRSRVIVFTGPPLLIILMLYLLTHVRHLEEIADNEGVLNSFPWIGIFADRLAKILTRASLVMFPAVASAWLTCVSGVEMLWKGGLLAFYSLALVILGCCTMRLLNRVQKGLSI